MSKSKKKGGQAHGIPQAQSQSTSEDAPKQQKPKKMSKREKREKKEVEILRIAREVLKQAERDSAEEKRAAKAQRREKKEALRSQAQKPKTKSNRARAHRRARRLQELESATQELNEAQLKELKNLRARLAPTLCALDLQLQSRPSAPQAAPSSTVSGGGKNEDSDTDKLMWATKESDSKTAGRGLSTNQRQPRRTSDHADDMSMLQVAARAPCHGLCNASQLSPSYLDGKPAIADDNMTYARLGQPTGTPQLGSYYTIDNRFLSRRVHQEKLFKPQANAHGLSGAEKAVPRTMMEIDREMAQIKKRLRELEEEELVEAGGMEVDV